MHVFHAVFNTGMVRSPLLRVKQCGVTCTATKCELPRDSSLKSNDAYIETRQKYAPTLIIANILIDEQVNK